VHVFGRRVQRLKSKTKQHTRQMRICLQLYSILIYKVIISRVFYRIVDSVFPLYCSTSFLLRGSIKCYNLKIMPVSNVINFNCVNYIELISRQDESTRNLTREGLPNIPSQLSFVERTNFNANATIITLFTPKTKATFSLCSPF
jgi:hypothetical protein